MLRAEKKTAFEDENAQESMDSGMFRLEGDVALAEVNEVLANQFLLRGRGVSPDELQDAVGYSACGYILDTSSVTSGRVWLVYNGSNCNNRVRTGTIGVEVQHYPLKKWKQKGCIVKVDFMGYAVRGITDGRTMMVNGTAYLVNESGATWYDMKYLNMSSVTQSVTGNDIRLTFDNTNIITINIKRRYIYNAEGGVIKCRVEGLEIQNSKYCIESWGINRDGKDFTCQATGPFLWNTNCGVCLPNGGEIKVNVTDNFFEQTISYGLSGNGETLLDGACPAAWKVSWSYRKKTNKRIFSYSR